MVIAPLVVGAAIFGYVSGSWIVAACLVAAAGASLATSWRMDEVGFAQVVFALLGVAAASGLASLLGDAEDGLHPFWYGLSLSGLMVGASRRFLARPKWGEHGTAAMVLIGVLGAGGTNTDLVYPAAVLVWAAAQVAAFRALEPSRPAVPDLARRQRVAVVVAPVVALGIAVSLSLALPPLHVWSLRQMRLSYNQAGQAGQAGFGGGLELGELTELLLSDTITHRVRGLPPGDSSLIRGIAFTRYRSGRWLTHRGDRARGIPYEAVPEGPETMVVEPVSGDASRYFVPLDAVAFATSGDEPLYADSAGVLRTPPGTETVAIRLLRGQRGTHAPVIAPREEDTEVPDDVRAPLQAIATEWAAGATTAEARLAAIEARLAREFTYALTFERTAGRDPLIDFLTTHRQGHCEYFASALALLSRTVGVPARVIGGYQVSEYNDQGGYHLVRERNAHAWVEVWLDDRWVTRDATPPSGTATHMPGQTPWLSGTIDAAAAALGRAWDLLVADGAWRLLASAAVLFGLLAVMIVRRRRRERVDGVALQALVFADPLACLALIEGELAADELVRARDEPLARFAARVRESDSDAADLLTRYVALRFGGRGDEAALGRDVGAWAEARQRAAGDRAA